jgi:hypothetical protein
MGLGASIAQAQNPIMHSEVISSTCYVVPGNGPYGQTNPNMCGNSTGTTTLGPASGTLGGNSTSGQLTVSNGPDPSLSASALGFDNGLIDANGAYTFISSSLTYDFSIAGPSGGAPTLVPILIAGSSSGTVSATPSNPAVNLSTASFAGSRLTLNTTGTNGVQNFGVVSVTGTPLDVYQGNGGNGSVAVSWGHSYLNGVPPYTDYSSTYLLRASVLSGPYVPGQNTVSLYVVIQGDSHVPGASRPTGTGLTGTASAEIDPYLYIDPTWLAANPGYTLYVDSAVGNVAPVPLPAAGWLLLSGLGAMVGLSRRRSSWWLAGSAA